MGVYYNPGGPCSPGGVGLLMSLPMLLENPGGPLRPGGGAIEDCTVVIPGGGGSENFGCSDSGGLCNGGGRFWNSGTKAYLMLGREGV